MTFSVGPVEAVWLLVNLVTLILTLVAFVDARADRLTVTLLNGKARELAAQGIVRREGFRIIVQVLLLSIAIPGLFVDRDIQLTPILAALIAVPLVLLVSSFLDARDRRHMTALVTADALLIRNSTLDRIERAVEENTEVSKSARKLAQDAYQEANSVNQKLEAQGRQILEGHDG